MPKRKPLAENCQYIRPEDAAAEIGCHVQYLRVKMAKKEWDLGRVEYTKDKGGKNKYFVFRNKLDKFLGK